MVASEEGWEAHTLTPGGTGTQRKQASKRACAATKHRPSKCRVRLFCGSRNARVRDAVTASLHTHAERRTPHMSSRYFSTHALPLCWPLVALVSRY